VATFNITRGDATYRVTVPDDQADSVTPEALAAMIDGGNAAPAAPPANPDTSFLGAIRHGAGEAVRGLGATARVAGNAFDDQNLRSAGEALSGALPADPNYQPATPEFIEGVRNMDRRALDYFPRAVAEQVPSLLLTRGAGRVAGVPGMVASGAGQSFGNIAETRAANDGRTPDQITGTDLGVAGVASLGVGALEAFGARGAAAPAGQRLANFGVVGRARELGRSSVREGVSEMPEQAVQQVAETAGTQTGLRMDPAEIIAAGPLGAGARGATGAPGAVLRGGAESLAIAGAERAIGDLPVEQAESAVRVNDLLERQFAETREQLGREPAPEDVLNSARVTLDGRIESLIREARRSGWIAGSERTLVESVFSNARRHNQELVDGTTQDPNEAARGLAQLDELQYAPPTFRQNLRALLVDLNTLSHAARKKNVSGPFERAGRAIGGVAGVGLGAAAGGPAGAIAAAAGAIGGMPLAARAGGAIGGFIDRMAGTRMPVVMMARRKAERIVKAAGTNPGSTLQMVGELNRLLNDDALAERARLGLATDPDTMAREAARQAEKSAKREEARQKREEARQKREQESRLQAEAIAAKNEAADRERAWQDYETRFRQDGASPDQVQAILDAERRAENARKAGDVKRAGKEMGQQAPDNLDAVTREQIGEYERMRADQERQARAAERAREAEQRARDAEAAKAAAEEQRALLAEIDRQIKATEAATERGDALRRRAEQRVEQQRLRDLERDAERAANEAIKAQKAAEAEAAKAAAEAAQTDAVKKARTRTRKKPDPVPVQEAPPPAQEARPAPSAAPAATTPAARPETPSTALPEAADEASRPITDRGPMRGWMVYVRRAFESKGIPNVSRQEMLAALDDAVEAGAIPEDLAEVYRTSMPTIRNTDYLDAILTRIAETRDVDLGASDVIAVRRATMEAEGAPQDAQPFYRDDVRDPASWQGAADSRQDHVRFYREQAVARSDFATAELLARFGTETERQLTPDERKVMARALINAAPEGQAGFRRAAVAPWLKGEALDTAPPPSPPPAAPPAPPPAATPPTDDASGQGEAVAAATKRARGRPKGSGKNQKAAAEAAAQQAEQALGGDGMVVMGSSGERVPATDALVTRFTEAFARAATGLREKLMSADEAEADKAAAHLEKLEAKLRELKAANAVWRRDVIEKGSMSD
jgi:hypothetical protein